MKWKVDESRNEWSHASGAAVKNVCMAMPVYTGICFIEHGTA